MKAIVLCAGLGSRLRPLTELWPKPAIPLLGQPLLRYTLGALKRAGVTEVGVNTHWLPERMEAVAQAECQRLELRLSLAQEPIIQGTGGGIRGLGAPADCPLLVLNGDILFSLDLAEVVASHRTSGAAATMVLLPMPEGEAFNPVEVNSSGAVRRIAGRGPGGPRLSPWHFSGVHVLGPRVFDFISPQGPQEINRDVYPRLIEAGLTLRAHFAAPGCYWSDLGTPQRYAAAHRDLLFQQADLSVFSGSSPFDEVSRGEGNWWAHPTASLSGARVSGPAYFAEGSRVESGARIGAAVSLGRFAKVGEGAQLNRVAVLDGAAVPPGAFLEDAILLPDGRILSSGASAPARR